MIADDIQAAIYGLSAIALAACLVFTRGEVEVTASAYRLAVVTAICACIGDVASLLRH